MKSESKVAPPRRGLPARDAVFQKRSFTSPVKARTYVVIRTTEADAYDLIKPKPPVPLPFGAKAKPPADEFGGTARKKAKLSIPAIPAVTYTDLKALLESLPADEKMIKHKPPIATTASSDRVKEETRNVRLKTFLYAASREADNDFHLILGRAPSKTPEMYMTMELSGLPPASSASFATLKLARDTYKAFFKSNLPGETYDFYDPPIPVSIEGPLFFDMSHAKGPHPGPQSLKSRMPTIWEVHPISKIVFEP